MQRIRRNDTVLVVRGRDRGRSGVVRQVFPREQRLVVTNVNVVKRHLRQRAVNQPGGIIEREAPLHWSTVKLLCRSCTQPARVGFRLREDGVKVRYCKKCRADID